MIDLFISYKIGLKDIKRTIPFTKLPFYRKACLAILLSGSITSFILLLFIQTIFSYIPLGISLISTIFFLMIDSKKKNLTLMLENYYIPYSKKRMDMTIEVLKKYNIDIKNVDVINLLIEEAKSEQIKYDYFLYFKNAFRILSSVIIPIVLVVTEKMFEIFKYDQMVIIAILSIICTILIYALILTATPIIKDVIYRDYHKYNELIHDLRQIKIFYANNLS